MRLRGSRVLFDDGDDAVRIVDGQSSKDDAIDHREDSGGRANARRQHTDGGKDEQGRLAESPNCGREILEHRVAWSFRPIRREEEPGG